MADAVCARQPVMFAQGKPGYNRRRALGPRKDSCYGGEESEAKEEGLQAAAAEACNRVPTADP